MLDYEKYLKKYSRQLRKNMTEGGKIKDEQRDKYLKEQGLAILRFSDREVFKSLNGVLESIWNYL